jgi:SWIM/SEC-C metal-binding protein
VGSEKGSLIMAKLGTHAKPAVVRVATQEKATEIFDICESNGWKVVIGVEPGKPEDISDVQKLLGIKSENVKTIVNAPQIGRNDPCPCGSGKKYKKCCGK